MGARDEHATVDAEASRDATRAGRTHCTPKRPFMIPILTSDFCLLGSLLLSLITGCSDAPVQPQQELPYLLEATVNRIETATTARYVTVLDATLPIPADTAMAVVDTVSFDGVRLRYQSAGRYHLVLADDSTSIPFVGEIHHWKVAPHAGAAAWSADVAALSNRTELLRPAVDETLSVSRPFTIDWVPRGSSTPVAEVGYQWLVLDSAGYPVTATGTTGGGNEISYHPISVNAEWASVGKPVAPTRGTFVLTRFSRAEVTRGGHTYQMRLYSTVTRNIVITP